MPTHADHPAVRLTRRTVIAGLPLALAACAGGQYVYPPTESGAPVPALPPGALAAPRTVDPEYAAMYGPLPQERFPIPALDLSRIDPKVLRKDVPFDHGYEPGRIVVQTARRYLYLVLPDGVARRYGVGVGREGLEFRGEAVIARKAAWPTWTPTPTMIANDPARYGPLAGGMGPGLSNPLGARALYLYRNGIDTLFRLHGTTEPYSIGQAVSSGCVRLFNHDVIHLYDQVPVNTRVTVLAPDDGRILDT